MCSKRSDGCNFDRQFDKCGLFVGKKTPEGETIASLRFRLEKGEFEDF